MSVVYGRNKDGSSVYHCAGKREDGERCGRRVQRYGGLCWQHRRKAEQARPQRTQEDAGA